VTILNLGVFLLSVLVGISCLAQTADVASPDLSTEIKKNEATILRSDYIHSRTLSRQESYDDLLDSAFEGAIYRNGRNAKDRWLDLGAGEGMALMDYLYTVTGFMSVVGITIESDPRYDAFRAQTVKDYGERFVFYKDKKFEDESYSVQTLGQFAVITDVYGAFSYSDKLSLVMQKIGDLLTEKGEFFSVAEDRKYKIVDPSGHEYKIEDWLNAITCMRWIPPSPPRKDAMSRPAYTIHMVKFCSEVKVPPLKLLDFRDDSPPWRTYLWQQGSRTP
jgi:SAM-dependent methyltransferase